MAYVTKRKTQKNKYCRILLENDAYHNGDDEKEEYHTKSANVSEKRISDSKGKEVVIAKKAKKGSMDLYIYQGLQKQ